MKLILTQEVDGLGAPGDIVEVKDGYGRNFLVPRKLAIAWTPGGQKQVAQIKRARDARSIRGLDHAVEVKNQLEAAPVSMPARAGDGGRLFGSITTADVAAAVRAAGGPLLDKRAIVLTGPIKVLGQHRIEVRLHPKVQARVTVDVVPA